MALIAPNSVMAATDPADSPLFASKVTLTARIEAPMTTIMRDRSETEYHDGVLQYVDATGTEHTLPLKLRTRGEYRRRKEVCDYAPLRLNFPKKKVEGSVFAGQDKLKLVTHCRSGRGNHEQYTLKEYFAYQILEEMTEASFRTRLMLLTYVDQDRKNRETTKYAFVIEEKEHIAERMGWEMTDYRRVIPQQLDRAQANLVSVFEYLIGNTDYSMMLGAKDDPCCHNITIYETGPGEYMPVPYDFDLAGLVDAPYAAPNPKYKLDAVTDRLYLGWCGHNDMLSQTLDRFADKQDEIDALLEKMEGLNKHRKREVRRFVDDFYEDIETPRDVERNFLKACSKADP